MISKACTKCGACLAECPTGSIVDGTDRYFIDADTCADHASCVEVCPANAIHLLVKPGEAPPAPRTTPAAPVKR